MKTFIVPTALTILLLVVASIENRISIYKLEQKINTSPGPSLANRPFLRDLTLSEVYAISDYINEASNLERHGYRLDHYAATPSAMAFYFTNANETITKIIKIME